MIIAVDFDGTIVQNQWPDIGPFRFLAKPVLRWLCRKHDVILWTCREEELLSRVIEFLYRHGIHPVAWNQNLPRRIKEYGCDCRKISADLYIDDKAGWVFWPLVWLKVLWMEVKGGKRA